MWRSAGRIHPHVIWPLPAFAQGRTQAVVTVRRPRPSPLQRAGNPLQSAAATLASIPFQLEGHIDPQAGEGVWRSPSWLDCLQGVRTRRCPQFQAIRGQEICAHDFCARIHRLDHDFALRAVRRHEPALKPLQALSETTTTHVWHSEGRRRIRNFSDAVSMLPQPAPLPRGGLRCPRSRWPWCRG
jgi:hypothetical protein